MLTLATSPLWFKIIILWIFGAFCALMVSFSWFNFNLLKLTSLNPIIIMLGGPLVWVLYITFKLDGIGKE